MDKITYEELDILITAYQDGNKDAASELIKNFKGYFTKFLNVIRNHNYNIGDPTQRNFVTLFMKGADHRKNAHLFRRSGYIEKVHYRTAQEIRDRYRHLDDDEIMNEMIVVFLGMAEKHNWKAPFQSYIHHYFPRKLIKVMMKWEVDPQIYTHVRFDENCDEEGYIENFDAVLEDKHPFLLQIQEHSMYDENWVNGFECGDIFGTLTIYERRIMKLYYEQKTFFKSEMNKDDFDERKARLRRTEDEIAERLGFSRKTINQKRNEAKERIREIAEGLSLIQG